MQDDYGLRFHPRIPRGSKQYQSVYKERTACERVNNRLLNERSSYSSFSMAYHFKDLIFPPDKYRLEITVFKGKPADRAETGTSLNKKYRNPLLRIAYNLIRLDYV